MGQIPEHPLERCLDLFFLNTVEHFTLVLSPKSNEELLMSAALPYLAKGGDNRLLEIFEAAHSVVLAVLASPKSAELAAKHLPYYIENLFAVCLSPHPISMTVVYILHRYSRRTSPPVNSDSPSRPSCKSRLPPRRSQTANPSYPPSPSNSSTTALTTRPRSLCPHLPWHREHQS